MNDCKYCKAEESVFEYKNHKTIYREDKLQSVNVVLNFLKCRQCGVEYETDSEYLTNNEIILKYNEDFEIKIKPHIKYDRIYKHWACNSEEKSAFYCCGTGVTMEKAYVDWKVAYISERWGVGED